MSFWERYGSQRTTRRRAIAATGAASLGAAFLAACGGGDKGSSDSKAKASDQLFQPVDTTNQAKVGGIFHTNITQDPPSVDPIASGYNPGIYWTASYAYPRLMKFKAVKAPDQYDGDFEGDLASSYELSPDKLKLTMKIRPGLKWDLPTGRTIDAQDVLFSWKKTTTLSRHRVLTDNNSDPNAPIKSITAPDAGTIVIDLVRPDPSIYAILASYNLMVIMPREAEGGFDPRNEVRGYGPWQFVSWKPSESITYKRNPDYYVKGRPFFDGIVLHNIAEYATRLAQFRSGNLHTSVNWDSVVNVGVVRPEDILGTKKDIPELLMTQDAAYPTNPLGSVAFGYEGDSQFKDQRVRQAFSLMVDRDATVDVLTNADKFLAEGIDVQAKANTAFGPGWTNYWLDPTDDKKFGANVKYMKYDVAEAKKLLTAAGFANGFDTSYVIGSASTASDILVEQLREGGIRSKYDFPPNAAETNRRLTRAYAVFENNGSNGYYSKGLAEYADFGVFIANSYLSGGGSFIGMTTTGREAERGDPEIDTMIKRIRSEFDNNKVQEQAYEFQRAMAAKAYLVPLTRATLGLALSWPAYANLGLWRTSRAGGAPPTETLIHSWLDDTKAPFKKA